MRVKPVLRRGQFDTSKQSLNDFYWLRVKARITFKILSFMNLECTNLSDCAPFRIKSTCLLRSTLSSENCYVVPYHKRNMFSNRSVSSFQFRLGPRLWNALVIVIQKSDTIDTFIRNLKKWYFGDFCALS